MSSTKLNPIPALITLIFISLTTLVTFVHGSSLLHHLQSTTISGAVNELSHRVVSSRSQRFLGENNDGKPLLVLAAERTHRKDPLDNLNYYTGGWNITNDHYISSAAFTGAPLVLIAAIWFVGFVVSLLLLCVCCCCCRKERYGYSRSAYALSLIFLSACTIAAIVGSAVLYIGQRKFHDSTTDTVDYVANQADSTVDTLRNVSNILIVAKHTGVNQIFIPLDVQNDIDNVGTKIGSAASALESGIQTIKKGILDVLDLVRLILVVLAVAMLVLAAIGFLFSILGLQFLVYILIIIGWILVTITFIVCAVFLVLHNVTGDTCVATNEWVKNPKAHTALDDLIPCVDTATAQETLSQSKEVIYQLVGVVNGIITNVSNNNVPAGAGPLSYNQSGQLVPVLCNPFNSDKTDRKCASGEVQYSNATQVWGNYVCQVSTSNLCTTAGRLTPAIYDQMIAVVDVSDVLYHYGPFLTDLLDCTFLRNSFDVIHNDHCPDLTQYSKWIYVGLAIVSAAVMLSLIFWLVYARERHHRKYTKLVDSKFGQ